MYSYLRNLVNKQVRFNFLVKRQIDKIKRDLDSQNFLEQQNKFFIKTFHNAYHNTKFYKNFYADFGVNVKDIQDISDLSKLPTLYKTTVKENTDKILTSNSFIHLKGYTSGTSGSPLVVYRDLASIIKESAYVWWYRDLSGLKFHDRKVSIRGDMDKRKLFYVDHVSNTMYISSFNLNVSNAKTIFNKIASYNPRAIIGYPSSLNTLSILAARLGIKINIPLAFTSSETLFPNQELAIKETFNSNLYDWYGNSERTIALYRDNRTLKYYEPPFYSINKFDEDKTLTTSLTNKVFPLINYEVDDLIVTSRIFSVEKKSVIIDKIEGRKSDYITLSDGSRIGSASLSLIFKDMDIQCAQIIQDKNESLCFNVLPGKKFSVEQKAMLSRNISSKLGDDVGDIINIITEDEVIYTNSGKFKFIIKS